MSFQSQILDRLASLNETLNRIATNAKRFFELPQATTVDLTAIFPIEFEGTTYHLSLQQLKDGLGVGGPKMVQGVLIPTQANQTQFLVPGNPEYLLLQKGRTNLLKDSTTEVRDFDYDASSGLITTTKGLIYNADETQSEKLYYTGFNSDTGAIQTVKITTEDQTEVLYSGAPAIVKVLAGRTNMIEGVDFTRTNFSENNKLVFTKGKPIDTLITIIKL